MIYTTEIKKDNLKQNFLNFSLVEKFNVIRLSEDKVILENSYQLLMNKTT